MKKIKKLFLAIALVLCASMSMPMISQIANFAYADTTSFSYLTIENFVDEVNVGGTYVIPKAKVTTNNNGALSHDASGVSVAVKDPFGTSVTLVEEGAEQSFEVKYIGNYKVIYSWGDYSQELRVAAKEGKYVFEFDDNSEQIIPSYINIEKYKGKITLPNPIIKDEDGKEIPNPQIIVEVLTPSGDKLNNEQLIKNSQGFYEFTANTVGVYTISYLYKSADNRILASYVTEFTANKTYNNDYKLSYSYNSSIPTTAVTGVETTLPSVTGKNMTTSDAVGVHYTIQAKRISYNTTTGEVIKEEDVTSTVIDGNKFTPDKDGDYIIIYNVKNFFGNSAESSRFEIKGVKDSKAPQVRFVSAYTDEPQEDDDKLYQLAEKHDTKNLVLPAIWADDNVSKELSELTLTRKIVKSNGDVIFESSENPNKELVFNYDGTAFTIDSNTQVEANLNEGASLTNGVYNVVYIAKDKAGNVSESPTYKITLETGFVDDEKPEVKWSESEALPSQTRVGDLLTFLSPSATDNVDTRLKLIVDYVFVTSDEPQESDWKTLTPENGEYKLEIIEANELRLRAKAIDNAGNTNEITATIDIIDTNDVLPTSIKGLVEATGNVYKQGNEITLNQVSYVDDYADYVKVGVYVKNENGTVLETYDPEYDITYGTDNDEIVLKSVKVLASYSGKYTVSYVSKDLKNNYTIYFYDFTVAAYSEEVEIGFASLPTSLNGGKMELGETIKMPTAEIIAPEGATKSYVVRQISGPTSEDTVLNKFEFTPAKKGVYKIQYYATVKNNDEITNPEKTFTIEVTDTTAPTLGEIYVEPVVALGYELTIPQFSAFDLSGIDEENSKVVLSSKSYGSKTIYYGDTTTNRVVTLNYNEVYTLTFTVKDIYNNTTTVTKTIKVGDTEPPVIEIDEENKKLVPSNVNIGDTLSIDLSLIKITDLVDTNISKDNLVIKLTRDNDEIANIHGDSKTNYEYKIAKSGTYKLTITVKDAAGNESEAVTRTFTVNADSNSGVDKNEVIGTVLVVISVLLLAGVIVYFIVSKKKSDKYKG